MTAASHLRSLAQLLAGLSAAAGWLSLASPAPSSAAGRELLFVGNNQAGTISVIQIPGYAVVGEIDAVPDREGVSRPFLGRILGLFLDDKYVDDLVTSPDGRVLYVSRSSLADVAAFDTATHQLLFRVPVSGLRADHIALSPDGRLLYVAAITAGQVDVIDTAKREGAGRYPTGRYPHGMALSADGQRVYTGSIGDGTITVADAQSFEVQRTLRFDAGVRPFVLTPDESRLYAQLSLFHGLVEYDLAADRLTRTLHLPIPPSVRAIDEDDYPNDAAHHGLALSPDGRLLCAAATLSGYVALVSRSELEVLATLPVGEEPGWAINSLDGRHCYVSSRMGDSVSVISYGERKEVARIPVGKYPQRMWTAVVP